MNKPVTMKEDALAKNFQDFFEQGAQLAIDVLRMCMLARVRRHDKFEIVPHRHDEIQPGDHDANGVLVGDRGSIARWSHNGTSWSLFAGTFGSHGYTDQQAASAVTTAVGFILETSS